MASKRTISGIVCMSLLLASLTACKTDNLAVTSETPSADGRTELILATDGLTSLGSMVSNFNKKSANYRIKVICYNNIAENTITLLRTEIIAGNPPDIYAFSQNSFADITIPIYEDLLPYIDADPEYSRETLIPCLYALITRYEHLYCIPRDFYITTFTAPESIVGERSHLTMGEAEKLAAAMVPTVSVFPSWMSSEDLLSHIVRFSLEKYINHSTGTCNFKNPEFVRLLELCKAWQPVLPDDYSPSLLMYSVLQNFGAFKGLHNFYGTDYSFVGFPTERDNSNILHIGQRFAISVSSKHKDAAWEFVRTAMSDEAQENVESFPSTCAAFDRQTKLTLAADPTKTDLWISPLDEEKLRNLLNSITMLYDGTDVAVYKIIAEETSAFFGGEKTSEEAASLIQSRASIYLAEKR